MGNGTKTANSDILTTLESQSTETKEADAALLSGISNNANLITSRLRQAIVGGAFSKGDQLPPERQLALALNTARSTVRKALNQLEEEKMVVRRVGSGTYVNYSGSAAVNDEIAYLISPIQLIETRVSVEPHMTRLAALHANQRDLEKFEEILEIIEACGDDQDRFTQYDSEFHLQLARCSRNPLMLQIYQLINTVRSEAQWNQVKRVILTERKIAEYNVEHRRIFEALRRRDVAGAADAMQTHLDSARQDLVGAESD